MNVTPEEARKALAAIQQTTGKVRRLLTLGAYHQIIWGVLMLVGFLFSQFTQKSALIWIWIIIPIVGTACSTVLGVYQGRHIRMLPGSRSEVVGSGLGITFPILYGYAILWFVIFQPLTSLQIALFWTTAAMFGYVVAGAWLRIPLLIGVGLGVTVVSVLGYYLLPTYFFLWEAVFYGGTLIVSGVYALKNWR